MRLLTSIMAAALLSRCLYRSFSTSLSLFMVFLFGCRSMAWKFTGSPYLNENNNPLSKSCKWVSLWMFTGNSWVIWRLHLKTDSTKTRRALIWIQAMKASLKFTLSHRTSGPCKNKYKDKLSWVSFQGRNTKKAGLNVLKTKCSQISCCAVLSFGHRRATISHFCKSEHVPLLCNWFVPCLCSILVGIHQFVCHSASFKLLLAQACHLNTYKLFLFVRREPHHLLFVGLHLLFIILEVSHCKPFFLNHEDTNQTSDAYRRTVWLIYLAGLFFFFYLACDSGTFLTCSLWLYVWSHQQLSRTEWRCKVRCHCPQKADCKR